MNTVDLVTSLYDAFEQGDIAGATDLMDERMEWSEAEGNPYAPDGAPFIGADGIVAGLFSRLATEWEGFAVHPNHIHDAGDVVVVEGRYSGRHLETAEHLDAQFCHVWTRRADKLARFQQYVDTAQLQDAMGAG